MKNTLIKLIVLTIILPLQAQDITHKLGGNTTAETFDITDSNDNLLFRMNGEGNAGIGIAPSFYKLDINGTLRTKYFIMETGGNDGYVLKSSANGHATWQPDFDISAWFSGRLYIVQQDVTVNGPSSAVHNYTMTCDDSNDLALSVGYSLEYFPLTVIKIQPMNSNSIKIGLFNDGPASGDATLYCNCLEID